MTILGVAGDLVLVRLRGDDHPLCAVQVGAIHPVVGYERAIAERMASMLKPGPATMRWLSSQTPTDMARVQLHQAGQPSPDVAVISAGWATPRADAPEAVMSSYRLAVQDAAVGHLGAWADAQEEYGLRTSMQTLLGRNEDLSPSYVRSHPAFCSTIAILGLLVVFIVLRNDHAEITEEQQGQGPVRRIIGYPFRTTLRQLGRMFFTSRPPPPPTQPTP